MTFPRGSDRAPATFLTGGKKGFPPQHRYEATVYLTINASEQAEATLRVRALAHFLRKLGCEVVIEGPSNTGKAAA